MRATPSSESRQCDRRKMCQWRKRPARRARAAWESTRVACAEAWRGQFDEALMMTMSFRLLQSVIRRFAGNDHVMHVALAQSRAADADEPRLLLQLRD